MGMYRSSISRNPAITGISPQAWGCTGSPKHRACNPTNLPTSVGMYRKLRRGRACWIQSPHKRGDVPPTVVSTSPFPEISPQAWGCTVHHSTRVQRVCNLPTSVGMYPRLMVMCEQLNKSPHKRGDVPYLGFCIFSPFEISPQAWGCTEQSHDLQSQILNLPTSVGMYLSQ